MSSSEEAIVRKLLNNIKQTESLGNNVVYHKEWYPIEMKGGENVRN